MNEEEKHDEYSYWKIEEPVNVLDCGCGFGYLGVLLLPLLPKGSTYTGVDFSKEMLDAGKKVFKERGWNARFVCDDIFQVNLTEKYDMVISQATLRHVNDGELFLKKMIEFARKDGLIVSIECNREFEEDGLYIQGMDYAKLCGHEGFEKLWKKEYEMQGRDYAIAMKVPHYMKALGLKNVNVRMNDRVTYLEPEQEGYEQIFSNIRKSEKWENKKTKEEMEESIAYFMNHGMSRKEAADYCEKQNEMIDFIQDNNEKISLMQCRGTMISYGWK